jgi:hypothetical protein
MALDSEFLRKWPARCRILPLFASPLGVSLRRNVEEGLSRMSGIVTIPFPEGLTGDYACACDNQPAPRPMRATPPAPAEAARAFRASLMRLAHSGEPAAGPLPPAFPTRIAA